MEKCVECSNCQSPYGKLVNVRDGGKAEWKCRDCGKVQPWVDEPVFRPDDPIRRLIEVPLNERLLTANVEMGGKLTDALVLLRSWFQECDCTDELRKETAEFLQEPAKRAGGLRPAKVADLAKRPAWIEAAQMEIGRMFDIGAASSGIVGEIIERHWRGS